MPYLAGASAAAGTTLALVAGIWFARPVTAWFLALMTPALSCLLFSACVFCGAGDSEPSRAQTVFRVVVGVLLIVLTALLVGLLVFLGVLE